MVQLTGFEINLLRLGEVWHRMRIIFEDYEKLPYQKEYGAEGRFLDYGMKSVVREYAIIQLDNFIEIRRALLADFATAGKKDLDPCLEPLWSRVLKHERVLKKLRNSFYAHVDPQLEDFIEVVLRKYDYPSGFGDTLFLVGCIFSYCVEVNENFRFEWQVARDKLKILSPKNVPSEIIKEDQVVEHLGKLQIEAAKNLRAHNLRTRIDRDKQQTEIAK